MYYSVTMKNLEFLDLAKAFLPLGDPHENGCTETHEDLGNGWSRLVANHPTYNGNPKVTEVNIIYDPHPVGTETKKGGRKKAFGVWCYKKEGDDWDIGKVFRGWHMTQAPAPHH